VEEKSELQNLWWGCSCIILGVLCSLVLVYFFGGGIEGVKDWLIPISSAVLLITIAISSLIAVLTYRLKIEKEKRLSLTSQIESEIRLLKIFSEMMPIVDCRHDPIVSDKVIEGLFKSEIITKEDYQNYQDPIKRELVELKLQSAILFPLYTSGTQNAAIAAIYELGKKNPILRSSAIEGLTSVLSFHHDKELKARVTAYLTDLKSIKEG